MGVGRDGLQNGDMAWAGLVGGWGGGKEQNEGFEVSHGGSRQGGEQPGEERSSVWVPLLLRGALDLQTRGSPEEEVPRGL